MADFGSKQGPNDTLKRMVQQMTRLCICRGTIHEPQMPSDDDLQGQYRHYFTHHNPIVLCARCEHFVPIDQHQFHTAAGCDDKKGYAMRMRGTQTQFNIKF